MNELKKKIEQALDELDIVARDSADAIDTLGFVEAQNELRDALALIESEGGDKYEEP